MAPVVLRVTAQRARSAIAGLLLPPVGPDRLGEVVLARHQVDAVRRITTLLAAHGGALLADDVGLGKTFVALAVARACRAAIIIAPAGLREMWEAAMSRAHVAACFESYESLSRRAPRTGGADLVILDEAHHARSMAARRYGRIAVLAAGARVLLLTATPVPNRLDELRHLFALFMGERAWSLDHAALSSLIVRRTAETMPGVVLPPVRPPQWVDAPDDSACLEWLAGLPPPVPPAGGGDGGALLHLSLVRQWASSRAALVAALRRRLATACALEQSLGAGRMPTRPELRTWEIGDDAMQLAFPEIAACPAPDAAIESEQVRHVELLHDAVRRHREAVHVALDRVRRCPDPDAARAGCIVAIRNAHPGEKVVCFTGYARTAAAYWRHLRHYPGVGRLWSRGGEIASGSLTRRDVLRRFAPQGQRSHPVPEIEDISLLIATDVLAEGVDLRDATVVVHLDLPWSPARMEQRVGRARRLGSRAAGITVYAMRPPAPLTSVLDIEARLRAKIAVSGRAVGQSASLLPDVLVGDGRRSPLEPATVAGPPLSDTERMSRAVDRVAGWCTIPGAAPPGEEQEDGATLAAVTTARTPGWLALLRVNDRLHLAARLGGVTGSDATQLERAIHLADAGTDASSVADIDDALAEATRYAREVAAALCIGTPEDTGGVRRRVVGRIDAAYRRAPVHLRPRIAELAAAARRVATGRLPAGSERSLDGLCATLPDDEAWLAAVAALQVAPGGPVASAGGVRVEVLIVFHVPSGAGAVATPTCRA